MASATAGGTNPSIGWPKRMRARICEEETPKGNPASGRPWNGSGKGANTSPGRGMTTNSTNRANSLAARHWGNSRMWSAPMR